MPDQATPPACESAYRRTRVPSSERRFYCVDAPCYGGGIDLLKRVGGAMDNAQNLCRPIRFPAGKGLKDQRNLVAADK